MLSEEITRQLEGSTIDSITHEKVSTGGEQILITTTDGKSFSFHADMVDYDTAGIRVSEES